jgi:subtilisin family serine protease/subtilisin-like proprotein convertase family protein
MRMNLRQAQHAPPRAKWHKAGCCIIGACMAIATVGPVYAQEAKALSPDQAQWIDIGHDRARFVIQHPEQQESIVYRLGDDLASKTGAVPPPTQMTMGSVVVVVAEHDQWQQHLPATEAKLTQLHPLTRVWLVQCGSVQHAVDLANTLNALEPGAGILAAYPDTHAPRRSRSGSDVTTPIDSADVALGVPLTDDPLFEKQWTLHNTLLPGADARVPQAWRLGPGDRGFTGKGVVVGIVEGPIDSEHPDLIDRFAAELSMAASGVPSAHSTGVAGIVAAARNGVGMVGVAPGARIATMPAGSTVQTMQALLHEHEKVRINVVPWGSAQRNRITRLDPATREVLAFLQSPDGMEEFAGPIGTAIVSAAGNGGMTDRLDADGFASSRYVLPVASVGDLDLRATYTEPGSAQLICAHSSGNARSVVATKPGSEWVTTFGGTSAAAPLVAGVLALALEANPSLTPRDLEHLLVRTARVLDTRSGVWTTNSAGIQVSELHGFGTVDAHALVQAAMQWQALPPLVSITTGIVPVGEALPDAPAASDQPDDANNPAWDCASNAHTVTLQIDEGLGIEHDEHIDHIDHIEHIELIPVVATTFIGDLSIELISPSGTVSVFAKPSSDPQDDLRGHVFTSRRHWGESAAGVWTVRIADCQPGDLALWESVELSIHGTRASKPNHQSNHQPDHQQEHRP